MSSDEIKYLQEQINALNKRIDLIINPEFTEYKGKFVLNNIILKGIKTLNKSKFVISKFIIDAEVSDFFAYMIFKFKYVLCCDYWKSEVPLTCDGYSESLKVKEGTVVELKDIPNGTPMIISIKEVNGENNIFDGKYYISAKFE